MFFYVFNDEVNRVGVVVPESNVEAADVWGEPDEDEEIVDEGMDYRLVWDSAPTLSAGLRYVLDMGSRIRLTSGKLIDPEKGEGIADLSEEKFAIVHVN